MANPKEWQFYGRHLELRQMERILAHGRWFFYKSQGAVVLGKQH